MNKNFKKGFSTLSKQALLKTPLFKYHQEILKAIFFPFAGYEMPLQYPKGMLEEHLHCRESAGFFDCSHLGHFKIWGKDRFEFLETLMVSDIKGLKDNSSTLSLLLNEKGAIVDDAIVSKFEDHIHVAVNAVSRYTDKEHIFRLKETLFPKADLNIEFFDDQFLISVQGPRAAEVLQKHFDIELEKLSFLTHVHAKFPRLNTTAWISRAGFTGGDGFELAVDNKNAEKLTDLLLSCGTIKPCGLGSKNSLRIEAGLCLYGNELLPTRTPAEAGLMWTIRKNSEKKFFGAEALEAKIKEGLKEKRTGFVTENDEVAENGAEIYTEEGELVGNVSSATFSPILKRGIGMGYISVKHNKIGRHLKTKAHGHFVDLRIVKMPFVAAKYYKI